jgi:hypothetical protein
MDRRTNSQASPQAGPQAGSRRRRNPAPVTALHQGIPAGDTNLTPQERALLPDPDWVTEDDADAIIGRRREREPGRRYSLEEVLRENGYQLEP